MPARDRPKASAVWRQQKSAQEAIDKIARHETLTVPEKITELDRIITYARAQWATLRAGDALPSLRGCSSHGGRPGG